MPTGRTKNVILLSLRTQSGNDVFYGYLARCLAQSGISCQSLQLPNWTQKAASLARFAIPTRSLEQADIVITNLETASYLPRIRIPIIGVAHHNPSTPSLLECLPPLKRLYYKRWLGRQFKRGISRSHRIVSVSKATADDVTPLLPATAAPPLHIIQNGIDTERFTPASSPAPKRGNFKLLFVGNASPRKGFDLLPAIMDELGEDFQLRYTTGLRSTRKDLADAPNALALGRLSLDQLLQEYRDCDALLFPSRIEGFGYAAVEAMSCGKPVIGVRCSTLPEIIPAFAYPLLADKHDPLAIADCVRLAHKRPFDPHRLRPWAKERFSLERMASDYLRLFDSF